MACDLNPARRLRLGDFDSGLRGGLDKAQGLRKTAADVARWTI